MLSRPVFDQHVPPRGGKPRQTRAAWETDPGPLLKKCHISMPPVKFPGCGRPHNWICDVQKHGKDVSISFKCQALWVCPKNRMTLKSKTLSSPSSPSSPPPPSSSSSLPCSFSRVSFCGIQSQFLPRHPVFAAKCLTSSELCELLKSLVEHHDVRNAGFWKFVTLETV